MTRKNRAPKNAPHAEMLGELPSLDRSPALRTRNRIAGVPSRADGQALQALAEAAETFGSEKAERLVKLIEDRGLAQVVDQLEAGTAGEPKVAGSRPRRSPDQIRAVLARYRAAARAHADAFPTPDATVDDAQASAILRELNAATATAVRTIRAVHGGTKLSPLGEALEAWAPQAVAVDGTVAVAFEPGEALDGEGPYVVLIDVADIETVI